MPNSTSWWLKVDRAQKHLREFERAIGRPRKRRPYTEDVRIEPDSGHYRWSVRLQVTGDPDFGLAVIAGDVLHNLRTALDHCAVAVAPPQQASVAAFPLVTEDFWCEDESGRFIRTDDEARRGREIFARRTKGMPDGALAVVESAQPYRRAGDPRLSPLGLLSRLENADKHRQLLITQYVFDVSHLPWVGPDGLPLTGSHSQSAMGLEASGSVLDPNAHVQIGRRVSVAIKGRDDGDQLLAVPTLQSIAEEVSAVLRDLEQFARDGSAA